MGLLLNVLGLLACWYVASGLRQWAAWGSSDKPGPQGSRLAVDADRKSGRIGRVRISVPTRTALDFECRPETDRDRSFKGLGYSVEQQVRHAGFDDAVYLLSDDRRVLALLRRQTALTDALAALFSGSFLRGYTLLRMRCGGGRLSIEFRADPDVTSADPLVADMVPRLKEMAALLPPLDFRDVRRSPAKAHLLVVTAVTALCGNALLQFVRLRLSSDAFILEWGQWLLLGSFTGALLLAGLLLWLLARLGGSSYFHIVLAQVLAFGSVGAWANGMVLVRDLNVVLPQPQATIAAHTITRPSATTRSARRAGLLLPRCRLNLATPPGTGTATAELERVRVPCRLQAGEPIAEVHPGALGIAWVRLVFDR